VNGIAARYDWKEEMIHGLLADHGLATEPKGESLSEAIASEIEACMEVPDNRSPCTLYEDKKVLATVIPCERKVVVIFPSGDMEEYAR